ncbi:MAG TPA: hypothetical protein VHO90_09795 [Bacteroidales bacterium]|nr:hypothetical protein [Bacteroidales bacterium]
MLSENFDNVDTLVLMLSENSDGADTLVFMLLESSNNIKNLAFGLFVSRYYINVSATPERKEKHSSFVAIVISSKKDF